MTVQKETGLSNTTPEFAVGDRVRLCADGAENWIDPKLRLRARKGIPATVRAVLGTAEVARMRSYRIEFDKLPRLDPMSEIVHVRELEALKDV